MFLMGLKLILVQKDSIIHISLENRTRLNLQLHNPLTVYKQIISNIRLQTLFYFHIDHTHFLLVFFVFFLCFFLKGIRQFFSWMVNSSTLWSTWSSHETITFIFNSMKMRRIIKIIMKISNVSAHDAFLE